jgi:hypothetical protein
MRIWLLVYIVHSHMTLSHFRENVPANTRFYVQHIPYICLNFYIAN